MRTEESNLQLNQFQATAFSKNQNDFLCISLHHLLIVSQTNSALFSCSHILQLQQQHLRETEKCNETAEFLIIKKGNWTATFF